jgi:hypothetical protein
VGGTSYRVQGRRLFGTDADGCEEWVDYDSAKDAAKKLKLGTTAIKKDHRERADKVVDACCRESIKCVPTTQGAFEFRYYDGRPNRRRSTAVNARVLHGNPMFRTSSSSGSGDAPVADIPPSFTSVEMVPGPRPMSVEIVPNPNRPMSVEGSSDYYSGLSESESSENEGGEEAKSGAEPDNGSDNGRLSMASTDSRAASRGSSSATEPETTPDSRKVRKTRSKGAYISSLTVRFICELFVYVHVSVKSLIRL